MFSGIFVGNSIAHLANDESRFREPRASALQPGLFRYKLSGV